MRAGTWITALKKAHFLRCSLHALSHIKPTLKIFYHPRRLPEPASPTITRPSPSPLPSPSIPQPRTSNRSTTTRTLRRSWMTTRVCTRRTCIVVFDHHPAHDNSRFSDLRERELLGYVPLHI
ncbi:uncharacterized protein MYCGRDRAFT_78715 [Zymoseptoria tritici IPO323]|uniref:Uncharacterized protein n=1 Tax=Zymoseptoria tritici (strain CBS 115943 / IPO323) TaxID=336722 RepID=F9WZC4_ZYMTI|nr:uncharacterized protein MYCGRDRAFT_78715 [Zymoseptoria tritici IPO323]EGP92227.1 hypothetical protein MYCGRDRAFT_78715 [Zymoseptoria tritici IPO323]